MAHTGTITKDTVRNPAVEDLAEFRDFWALVKPRVMSLSIFTALVGLLLAPGSINPVIGFSAILFIAVGAGASGALNMWYEGDVDALMERTKKRPIPMGRLDPGAALGFGVTLGVASVTFMGLLVNWAAAALLAGTILFYVVVYTMWLKRRTPQNIVIGGAAGALPPMVGWAAVTGSVSIESLILFAIIFTWTPAHFWALALSCKTDYDKAGIPMMPNVEGRHKTIRMILFYTVITVAVSFAPVLVGFSGAFYALMAAVFGLLFIGRSGTLLLKQNDYYARNTFLYSILYLFAIFSSLLADHFLMGGGA